MEFHDFRPHYRFQQPATIIPGVSNRTRERVCHSTPALDALISDFRKDCTVPFNPSIVQAGDGSVEMLNSQDWESQRRYMTHVGYRVRSKAEKIITDFLTASDLAFVYEPRLKTGNLFLRPDFYFPEYGLLYEHFGLNTPQYLQSAEAKIRSYHQAGIPFMYTTFNDETDIEDVIVDKLALAILEM
jgi:hypothetical protein